jgi:WD40 repeat protein
MPVDQKEQPAADPGRITTQQEFAQQLTRARQHAGRTIRDVAKAAGIPVSTAGDYFAGRHLPPATQPDLLPRILAACGETDPGRLAEWASALARVRRGPGRPATVAPYRGLASFQPEDASWFFGRAGLTSQLVRAAAPDGGPPGVPLVVVGPSGSGKSSVLRAGLIPAVVTGPERPLALFTPGAAPLAALAGQLAALAGQDAAAIEAALRAGPAAAGQFLGPAGPAGARPVIVVDQLEEVFTTGADEAEQGRFLTAVCALSGPAVVAIALRADFYHRALRHPGLARALQERQVVVGPMTRAEVVEAIVAPARLARLGVADGLVELLLRDLSPHAAGAAVGGPAHEAGALPLLSHALLTTWARSHGGQLTVADYQATGGIQHAIGHTADEVYESLDPAGQEAARWLFLRLVHVADDEPETRSAVQLDELHGWDGPGGPPGDVLARFVAARLITVDSGTARISHDALLTAWPKLRGWIDADRDGLRTRRRISDAARAWAEAGRDPAALLRGAQLTVARDWATDPVNAASLTALTREFLAAASTAEKQQHDAERQHTRLLRRLVAALTVLVLVTVGLAAYAFSQREAAVAAGRRATSARDIAQSREVAIEADQVRGQNPALAAQLSLAAYRIAATPDARASLLESTGTPAAARLIDSADVVQSVSLSPDHRVLAVAAADGTLRLWNLARPGHPVPLGPALLGKSSNPLYTTAFSPDGRVLAAAGAARQVLLWNVANPAHPVRLGGPLTGPASTVYSVAFSPDGRLLAAGSADKTVRLWDVADPAHPTPLGRPLTGAAGYVESVAFSPDGGLLAAGCADQTVRLWNVRDPAHVTRLGQPLTGLGGLVSSVAFSPDGRTLAAASQDDKVWLWHLNRSQRWAKDGALTGASDWVNTVSFSPDGRSVAAGSSDDRVLVWALASRTLTAAMPNPQPVTSLAWAGPGRLISGDADGMARIWTLPTPVLRAVGPVNSVAYVPAGGGRPGLLAVGGSRLELWNPARRTMLAAAAAPPGAAVNAVAVAPGGQLIAAGSDHGQLQLWHVTGAGTLSPDGPLIRAQPSSQDLVESAAFSPDGRLLATSGDDGTIRLWSVTSPGGPRQIATVRDSGTYVFSVAFRPDGRTLAAASADGQTKLWDIADPAHPVQLGRPLAGPQTYAISVAFSPDGQTLAVGLANHTVRLWNVADVAQPRPAGGPLTGPGGYVYSVAFSPDGRTLAAGVTDGTVWLWRLAAPARPRLLAELTGPRLLAELTGPAGQVYSVAFSPGGGTLAAASADGTVRLWDTAAAAAAQAVCATAGQPLTRAEWAAYLPSRAYQPPCPAR